MGYVAKGVFVDKVVIDLIESKIKREEGTYITIGGFEYRYIKLNIYEELEGLRGYIGNLNTTNSEFMRLLLVQLQILLIEKLGYASIPILKRGVDGYILNKLHLKNILRTGTGELEDTVDLKNMLSCDGKGQTILLLEYV